MGKENPLVAQLAQLDRKIKDTQSNLDALKKEREELERLVRQSFVSAGIQSIKLSTGETAYLKRKLYASKRTGIPTEFFVEKLKKAGKENFISEGYNPSQFAAWVRELEIEHKARTDNKPLDDLESLVPEELKGLVTIYEQVKVSIIGGKR